MIVDPDAAILDLVEDVEDILKRLYTIENILLQMTDVIDIARNFDERLKKMENQPTKKEVTMQAPIPSPQEIMIKQALLEKGYNLYVQLINFFKGIPVNQQAMQLAYQNLDQGMHWFEKILQGAQILEKPAPEATPAPVEEPSASVTLDHLVPETNKNEAAPALDNCA